MATACKAPTMFTAQGQTAEGYAAPGFTVIWSGAAPGAANAITGYGIRFSRDNSPMIPGQTPPAGWGDEIVVPTTETAGSYVTSASTRGSCYAFQIRTRGAAGSAYYSPWKDIVPYNAKVNQLPASPTISYPQAGEVIYSPRPRILLESGADLDTDQAQTITTTGWSASHAPRAGAQKIVMRMDAAAATGEMSVTITQNDTLEQSTADATVEYVEASYTDTLAAGTTRIKAEHINELRGMIDDVRGYYGLAAYSWADAIVAQVTSMANWATHIGELRTAIEQIAAVVNTWDTSSTTNRIVMPAWITITGKQPTAAVLQQIRDTILIL